MAGKVAAVVVAAGRGLRAGGDLPKQYRQILGEPVIRPSLAPVGRACGISAVQPVIHPDDAGLFDQAAAGLESAAARCTAAPRGRPRSAPASRRWSRAARTSCWCTMPRGRSRRPALVIARDRGGASERRGGSGPRRSPTPSRRSTRPARHRHARPRASCAWCRRRRRFDFAALLEAHRRARAAGRDDFTDDAALAEWAGMAVTTFEGEAGNVKLTTDEDFARAEARQARRAERCAHRLRLRRAPVRRRRPRDARRRAHRRTRAASSGHSDADVVLHALVDAILGALADGDIGVHFPPSDPQWRGASSDRFLAFAVERVRARGGRIAHLDVDRRLRGAAGRPASRRHARAHRRDRRHSASSASA